MSEEMSLLFSMMKQELEKQTTIITEAVTANIMRSIDEKIKPLVEENKMLQLEVEILNSRINRLEDTNRKNNIIIHGVEETETNFAGLFGIVGEILGKICVRVENYDINKIYRLGKQSTGKIRPIMISLTTYNKKIEILKGKTRMPVNTHITEDFSKETLQKRKELQGQLREEREKGNQAFIKNNKVIVKQTKETEKRKRDSSTSPGSTTQQEGKKTVIAPAKLIRTDPFAYMRSRSHSLTEKTPTQHMA